MYDREQHRELGALEAHKLIAPARDIQVPALAQRAALSKGAVF